MLAIRMQRTGRKGYPTYRLIVQESHHHPTSGRIVTSLGSYNPHTKQADINREEAEKYLSNGAQPSDRAIVILEGLGVKMPGWVKKSPIKSSKIKHPEKLRKNQPKEEPVIAEAVDEEVASSEAELSVEAVA